MRGLIKQLLPPILLNALKGRSGWKAYSSWGDAEKDSILGYSNSDLINLVLEKTRTFKANPTAVKLGPGDLALIAVIGKLAKVGERFPVIDFGGACGAHYFLAKAIFPQVVFDWRVVETAAMATAAKQLESDELRFFDDLDKASVSHVGLVHTSGTLQCVQDPIETLARLGSIRAPLLVNRLGVSETSEHVITVHHHMMSLNGKGATPKGFVDRPCAYPFQFPSRAKIERVISRTHTIDFIADDPTGVFPVGSAKLSGLSYFCFPKPGLIA